jgi:hypothetical protein
MSSVTKQSAPVTIIPFSSNLAIPLDFSTTPGGTLYSTTPGGTRIIYDRAFLLRCKDSPYSKSSPNDLKLPSEINAGRVENMPTINDYAKQPVVVNGVKDISDEPFAMD